MTEKELISKAMAALGRRKSKAKTRSCRLNAKRPRKRRANPYWLGRRIEIADGL